MLTTIKNADAIFGSAVSEAAREAARLKDKATQEAVQFKDAIRDAKDAIRDADAMFGSAVSEAAREAARLKDKATQEAVQLKDDATREAARLTEGATHLAYLTDRAVNALADKLNATGKSTKISYGNGDHYEGETHDGPQRIRHGYGVYTYRGGLVRYEGEFVNDEMHGSGTLFCEGGDAYQGQWCNDREHGRGALVHWSPLGGVWVYSGDFRDGQRQGYGTLHARDSGTLLGTWVAGGLVRGVEVVTSDANASQIFAIGDAADAPNERAGEGLDVQEPQEKVPKRTLLEPSPRRWSPSQVSLWLKCLDVEVAEDKPGAAYAALTGSQLLALKSLDEIADQSQATHAWRTLLATAHTTLKQFDDNSGRPLQSWAELQDVLPNIGRRLLPRGEITTDGDAVQDAAPQTAEWRGMSLELLPLPLQLPAGGAGPDERTDAADINAIEGSELSWLPLAAARGFARDIEALAAVRHPNIRSLLGITLTPLGVDHSVVVPTLVYEGARGANLMFEIIHATLPDGGRQPMDFRLEIKMCIGILEGLASLVSRDIVFGGLCSVNVEISQASGREFTVRLTHTGVSWWRLGWRRALKVREAGQPRRQALSMENVIKKYALCPVNWLSPEVLRGEAPSAAGDIYGFGMVLWEMLYRDIPFGDYSIAQIIGAVGYGRKGVRAVASSGASTETTFLHEVVSACTKREPSHRARTETLLSSLQDASRAYERRRAERSALEKMEDKTKAVASNLLSGKLPRGLFGGASSVMQAKPAPTVEERKTFLYLPRALQGKTIAVNAGDGKWKMTNEWFQSPGQGLAYRTEKKLDASLPNRWVAWEDTVQAVEADDEWLTCECSDAAASNFFSGRLSRSLFGGNSSTVGVKDASAEDKSISTEDTSGGGQR